jgi:hypothetical protein
VPNAPALTSNYVIEIGSRLEIGYRLNAGTSLEVKYSPQGGQSSLIAAVTDEAISGNVLPYIAFEEEGNGELTIIGKMMKSEAWIEVDIFGSPAIGARFRWFARSITGQPVPTPADPLIQTFTANILVVKPRRS